MDKTITLSLLGFLIATGMFWIAIIKFSLNGYMLNITNQVNKCSDEVKRVEADRKDCRAHCERCRTECARNNKDEFRRVYDKIKR